MSHNGLLISIEGSSRRSIKMHARLLEERLKAADIAVLYVDSRDSERPSSYFVNQYRRGNFGKKHELGPYLPSLFYGIDRFATLRRIEHRLNNYHVVIIDRSILSDMHDLAQTISHKEERLGFYTWLDQFSHSVLQDIQPDMRVVISSKDSQDTETTFNEITALFPKYIDLTINDSQSLTHNIDTIWQSIKHKITTLTGKNIQPKPKVNHITATPILSHQSTQQIKKRFQKYTTPHTMHAASIRAQIGDNITQLMEAYALPLHTDVTFQAVDKPIELLQKNAAKNYKYYTPKSLDADLARTYESTMNSIFDSLSDMAEKIRITHQNIPAILYDLLPLATRRSYLLDAKSNTQEFAQYYAHLPFEEGLDIARQLNPKLVPQKMKKDVRKSAKTYGSSDSLVSITSYTPRNEVEVVPDALFGTQMANTDTSNKTQSYAEKAKLLISLLPPDKNVTLTQNSVLSHYQYTLEATLSFSHIQMIRATLQTPIVLQDISPRLGYEYPEYLDALSIGEQYEHCFDVAYKLFSTMQEAGYANEALYAVLGGHKQRFQITLDGQSLVQLLTVLSTLPALKTFSTELTDQLRTKHPLLIQWYES